MFNYQVKLLDEQNTVDLANKLASFNLDRLAISLVGELGAGKTFLVKRLVESIFLKCGCKVPRVHSPTFSILNLYQCLHQTICHLDLYRIQSEEEIINIGLLDYVDNLVLIEWADKINVARYFNKVLYIEILFHQQVYRIANISSPFSLD